MPVPYDPTRQTFTNDLSRSDYQTRENEMRVQLIGKDGYWSVWVNGKRYVDRESFEIASRIAESIERPELGDISETAEVAESIRRAEVK